MISKISYVFLGLFIFHGGVTYGKSRLRITDGNLADSAADNLPFQVVLEYENGQIYCGGTILDERYILTAAHCVEGLGAESINVIVGSNDLRSEAGTRHLVSDVIQHERFGPDIDIGPAYDIAMLRLALPIVFDNRYVSPAVLPKDDYQFPSGAMAVVSGFGTASISGSVSPRLYKTSVFIVSNSECQRAYPPGLIKTTHVCTAHPAKVTGFCKGDSGGPLSVNGTVVGVVSFSKFNGCANESMAPQVYTRVSEFVDWINHWRNT